MYNQQQNGGESMKFTFIVPYKYYLPRIQVRRHYIQCGGNYINKCISSHQCSDFQMNWWGVQRLKLDQVIYGKPSCSNMRYVHRHWHDSCMTYKSQVSTTSSSASSDYNFQESHRVQRHTSYPNRSLIKRCNRNLYSIKF